MHWTFYDFVGTKSNLLVLGIKCSGMAVSWQNFKNFTPSKAIVLLVWCLTLIYKTKTSYSKESASKKKILLTSTNALDKIVLHYYLLRSFPVRSKICGGSKCPALYQDFFRYTIFTKINSTPTK